MDKQLSDLKVGTLLLDQLTGEAYRKTSEYSKPSNPWSSPASADWRAHEGGVFGWGGTGTLDQVAYEQLEARFNRGDVVIAWQPAS